MVDLGNIGSSVPIVRSAPVKQEVALPSLVKAPAAAPVDTSVNVQIQQIEQEKVTFADVHAAAQVVLTNPYPVSDQRFTIFKDLAGDYVTRFTSLVDGSVEYYPQKTLFETVQILKSKISSATVLDTQA